MDPVQSMDLLELGPGYSRDEVDSAYRKMAAVHHPDAGGSHETMVKLNQAVRILTGELDRLGGPSSGSRPIEHSTALSSEANAAMHSAPSLLGMIAFLVAPLAAAYLLIWALAFYLI